MSEIARTIFGIGNEAFMESDPVEETGYVRDVVDVTDLVVVNDEVSAHEVEHAAVSARVRQLDESISYARNIPVMTEVEAREYRDRVIAVLGEPQTQLIVGSVESYNGANATQLLNAGLEGLGSFLKAALMTLIRLIKQGIEIMVRFITSAKLVLGRQIKAIGNLRQAIRNRKNWHEEPLDFTGADISALRKQQEAANAAGAPTVVAEAPVSSGTVRLTLGDVLYLVYSRPGKMMFPSDFNYALKETVDVMDKGIMEMGRQLNQQFSNALDLMESESFWRDGRLDRIAPPLVAKGFSSLMPKMLYADPDESQHMRRVYVSPNILGGIKMKVCIPYYAFINGPRSVPADDYAALSAYGAIELTLRQERSVADSSSFLSSVPILPLEPKQAENVLRTLETLLENVIDSKIHDDTVALGHRAKFVVDRYVARYLESNSDPKNACLTEFISGLTRLTAVLPRATIAYANNLATATRHYVEASANL